MSAPEVFQLSLGPLTGVAFSPDRTQVAVSPNSNEVHIYEKKGSEWELKDVLAEHDKLITAISWAPNSNRIVTCSQDRNAYVWTPTATGWKPALVLLRISRAATCVKWSPKEDKFAVGSGARTIAVCYFDQEDNWWVSKHVKKPLRSTVLSLDWHPNNVLLAAGTAESKAYVFSAYIKGLDAKPQPTVWGERLPFGTICGEFKSPDGGWVHNVAFSPSGDTLAFVAHDASISVVYPSAPGSPPSAHVVLRLPSLPFTVLTFTSESTLIAAGHDCQPMVFSGSPEGWAFSHSLDDPSSGGSRPLTPSATGSRSGGVGRLGNNEAFNLFKAADSKGQRGPAPPGAPTSAGLTPVGSDGLLTTVHQNTITWLDAYEWAANGDVPKVSTAGKDGRLVVWPVTAKGGAGGLAGRMGGLQV
ncbi:hypothetical protein, variant [Cryptococcus amylolentus CBS 6039]|uniref:Arp2/3 complex 41 kDa subunit n=2 Tax=Cryptococcus amylolentus TaxID=104669 RepID=A0A1E3HKJ6_9TREE|nr:hypothetical protein L202_05451 [Cryptococcus amylolentus CBS 6039]XP_018992235.1 hypothetical protein, variant [Cryptococcus amylolentus CBS 6039]ODN76860.1 hypothetical protein L202_05451 [Cryptococcus amylolentus CBS 6039]ODN76861.1 hypothetical protein, variant [Cryptococcus amylolentus CBS 6039]ODO04770.1 hypothetical protein I350_05380 [Cryptococcus amylolentus CBS 6273]